MINHNMDKFQQAFYEEAIELLEELEKSLIELDEHPDDLELIAKVFRALHTIKGSGSMFGFTHIAEFVHDLETIYDKIRNNEMSLTPEIITLTLNSKDLIREMVQFTSELPKELLKQKEEFTKKIQSIINKDQTKHLQPQTKREKSLDTTETEITYRITFKPDQNILLTGNDPFQIFNELKDLGIFTNIAYLDSIPLLNDLNPEYCYVWWEVILTTKANIDRIKDVFIFVEDNSTIQITPICDLETCEIKRIGEILVDKGLVKKEEIETILNEKPKIGELLVEKGKLTQAHLQAALAEQEHLKELYNKKKFSEEINTIKVDLFKLDKLVNLVGEIVTSQARLEQIASNSSNLELISVCEEMSRLTDALRDITMNIRMIPIGSLFNKYKRLVRDLSNELNKKVNLFIEGAETELDKNVIDKLNDPLVHLIRNSLDHGIETPEERIEKGKDPTGRLVLSARHSGAHVIISITDDGRGIDPNKIIKKAIERGLINSSEGLTEKEIYNLLFLPGFSTAEQISNVSGRGVGLDVVKKNIEALKGTVEITSELGKFTTINLKIPLTLAIIDGLLTRIQNEHYIIPLSFVEECVEVTKEKLQEFGGNVINVRGELVPYMNLRTVFNIPGDLPKISQVVIVRDDELKFGILVDAVLGDHQTVIKTLGSIFDSLKFISGATILGNGEIALILDLHGLQKLI